MTELTKLVLNKGIGKLFTTKELKVLMPSDNIRNCQIARSIKNRDFIRQGRGIYSLNPIYFSKSSPLCKQDYEDELKNIANFLIKNGAKEVYLFGSFARGEADSNSDFDIGIKGLPSENFFHIYAQLDHLSARQIDLVDFDTNKTFYEHLHKISELRRLS
ncbi:nucleotidyltransferase domain-containing protein [Treponema sp.]|uniref:nucleotidyltransferase family protein n=1 Tax=Treponema sp. TaxID=166 RepID=UPI003EFBC3EB